MASDKLLTVEINHEGVFVPQPLMYCDGVLAIVNDVDFAAFDFNEFHAFLRRLTGAQCKNLYYCHPKMKLIDGLRMLKSEEDYATFIALGYEHGKRISLYVDQYSENLNDLMDDGKMDGAHEVDILSEYEEMSDYLESDDDMCLGNLSTDAFRPNETTTTDGICPNEVAQQGESADGIRPKEMTPHLESAEGLRAKEKAPIVAILEDFCPNVRSVQVEEVESDTDGEDSDRVSLNEEDEDVDDLNLPVYPRHDPTQDWKLMQPVLGMKFESPKQLKQCLCNYGVANGYQLWFEKNDYKRLLVRCGKGNDGVRCPFRLWASWMGGEETFQIKSLNSNHNCSRNFRLGSIVSYVWIGNHFVKEILKNPKMSVRELQVEVMERFNIQVSVSQCRRAKSYAKNVIEGSLTDHYAKLWSYAEEIRRSNPGSTVKLDVETMPDGSNFFSKFYVCFKGLKDGWKEGCRRVIGLDGCFLKGICKGEVLSAVGRDANNHIYPIAWAVVCVENKANWKWFVDYLIDDLSLETGADLTVISDQHKGLVETLKELLPLAEHRQCARHYAKDEKKVGKDHKKQAFKTSL